MQTRGIAMLSNTNPRWATTAFGAIASLVVLSFPANVGAQDTARPPETAPPVSRAGPHTPAGMDLCTRMWQPTLPLPDRVGEALRYVVTVDELNLGSIDFRIERQGTFAGGQVLEYRSLFKLDGLVATFVPVEGRAAALVNTASARPVTAMNHYKLDKNEVDENMTFRPSSLLSQRTKNGSVREIRYAYQTDIYDFVSAFYSVRRLPAATGDRQCAIIYGNEHVYTLWLSTEGEEEIKTPVGRRPSMRYGIAYASERATKTTLGRVWLGLGPEHVPYQAEVNGVHHLVAHLHTYSEGKTPD